MNHPTIRNAGEVSVSSIEVMSQFEIKCIQILRFANNLFEVTDDTKLPNSIKGLFTNKFSRYIISDFISIFAIYNLRPIVRHHPTCPCVGADENIFANILHFAFENQDNDVQLLGALLIQSNQLQNFVQKAKVVALLIDEDLKSLQYEPKLTQYLNNNYIQ